MTIQNDIATKLITVNSSLSDIKDAIIEKGVTPTGDITTYAAAIGSISGGGTLESVTVAPSTTAQTITPPSGVDGFDEISVNAVTAAIDSDIQAGNIRSGVEILGVTGNYSGESALLQSKTFTASSTTPTLSTVEPDSGYDGLEDVDIDLSYIENRLSATNGSGSTSLAFGPTREITAQGVYQMLSQNFTYSLPSNATDVGAFGLYYAFHGCTGLTSVDLSSLTTVSGDSGLGYAFNYCTGLTSVDLSSLTTVSGASGLSCAFQGCAHLTSVDLSNLTTVSGYSGLQWAFSMCTGLNSVDLSSLITVSGGSGLLETFYNCQNLTSVDLSSLTTVSGANGLDRAFVRCSKLTSVDLSSLTTLSGSQAMMWAFRDCTSLTSLSFPSLTSNFNVPTFGTTYTTQFNNMLQGVTGCTVHFPSNLQSVIGDWADVTAGFGGTNTTVLFDLPATT